MTTLTLDVTVLAARGRFAVDLPQLSRVVSSTATESPSLLVRVWVELPSSSDVTVSTDPTSGLSVVQYVGRRAALRRRRFVLDGRGTRELSVRETLR